MAATDELPPEQELTEPLMDLTNLARTVDGTGFAYLSLSCVNKRINPIKIMESYTHLQKIDLSQNAIKDVTPLKTLISVISLNLASNEIPNIKSWEEGMLPHLQNLDLSGNLLTALLPLPFPALRTVSLARNDIATCAEFTGHEKLTSLDLSENKLTALAGIAAMPALTSLNLAGGLRKDGNPTNQLESIEGLTGVEMLQDLNLARNKFSNLQGAWETFPALTTLNVGENVMEAKVVVGEKPAEHPLNILRQLPKLRNLQVAGNPFSAPEEPPEDFNPRAEVLVCHWRLESIDGQTVTPEELEAARLLNISMLEQERARLKAEAEAAAAAEAES